MQPPLHPNDFPLDEWLMKPRASDDIHLNPHEFKAFSRISIRLHSANSEADDEQDAAAPS